MVPGAARPALLLCFLLLLAAAHARAVEMWSWHRHGQEIHSPAFSPDGREVAVSLRRQELTGRDAHSLSAAELTEHFRDMQKWIRENPRVFDPVVTILTLATGETEPIGYGYEPAYSPDGERLAFQLQKNPISGLREVAASLAGNEIWLHERATGHARMLAAPRTGSLGAPQFAPDGKSVVFALDDVVNGSWSGAVGVGRVDLATGAVSTSYAPRKTYDLPHIVAGFGFVGDHLYAAVGIPQAAGTYMADSYLTQLIALDASGSIAYSWGVRDSGAPTAAFATWPDRRVAVFDSIWKPVGPGAAVTAAASTARGWRSAPGVLSPDGRKIAREFASGIVISDTLSGRQIVEFPGPMSNDQDYRRTAEQNGGQMLDGITWSPDSRRIAWVEKIGFVTWDHETLNIGTLPR